MSPPPPLSHSLYELSAYGLWFLCLWHARRQGPWAVVYLVSGLVYGVLVELVGMLPRGGAQNYAYGPFWVMLFASRPYALPLCISAGWSIITYSLMQTTRSVKLGPWYAWPFIQGMLAVFLDSIMDPAAADPRGLALWTWHPMTDVVWLAGIPLINYAGWFVAVFFFSFVMEAVWRRRPQGNEGLRDTLRLPLMALPLALAADGVALGLYQVLLWKRPGAVLFLGVLLAIGCAVFLRHAASARRETPFEPVVLAVPAFFVAFFLGAFFLLGTYRTQGEALLTAPLALLALGAVFSWPYARLGRLLTAR